MTCFRLLFIESELLWKFLRCERFDWKSSPYQIEEAQSKQYYFISCNWISVFINESMIHIISDIGEKNSIASWLNKRIVQYSNIYNETRNRLTSNTQYSGTSMAFYQKQMFDLTFFGTPNKGCCGTSMSFCICCRCICCFCCCLACSRRSRSIRSLSSIL